MFEIGVEEDTKIGKCMFFDLFLTLILNYNK